MGSASGRPCRRTRERGVQVGVGVSGGFRRRRRKGGVAGTFEPLEVALLSQLLAEMVGLLEAEAGGSPPPVGDDLADLDAVETIADFEKLTAGFAAPDDPVLRRLLPDAYPDDAEASREFRRFTQDGLVARKHSAAQTALSTLAELRPPEWREPPTGPLVSPGSTEADGGVAHADVDRPPSGEDDAPHRQRELVLSTDQAQAWLGALNDIRLALAVRLGIEQDDDARWGTLPPDDPRATVHEIYAWLGWLQETLVRALW